VKKDISYFHTILPWNFITEFREGVVVQKDGILQRSFAYRAPDVDSLSIDDIDGLSIRVNDFAKRLGTGWAFFIEAQRFCLQDYPRDLRFSSTFDNLASYLIEKEREKSFTAAGKHFDSCYYLTVVWKPPSDNARKLARMFISSSGKGESTLQENVEYFVAETDSVIALLSGSVLIAPLDNEQTIQYLHSAVSFRKHWIRFPDNMVNLNRILCDSELQTSETMKLGDYYIPIVGVNDFPHDTYPAIFESLNRTRIEYRWVTRYICLSKEDGKKEAQKKEKSHRGSQESFAQQIAKSVSKDGTSGSKTINHGEAVKEQDSIDAGKEIELDDASLGYYTSCVMVWHEDYEKAIGKAKIVRNVINSAGFTCKEETWNALESFRSMMPGDVFSNYRALPVMSYNSAHCVPLSSVWAGLRFNEHAGRITGVDLPHVTCSTHEGTPFYLSLNPGGDVGHAAIWGPTGAGKSTLLNLLETQFFRYPDSQVIVFDKGRSCRQICLACGGLFFEPAGESPAGVSFQPLRDLETEQDIQNAMDFIESLFIANRIPVTPLMSKSIKAALGQMSEKPVEARHITSFLQYCEYNDPEKGRNTMKEDLADYSWGGKFGKVFDSRNSALSLDTRFLAFEMESLMNRGDGCIVPALVYLFGLVDKKFNDGRLTMLVLDEAWLFLKNEIFAEKIAEWLKVLRKKNVFVVFATQDVADVEKSPLKTAIVQQCLTKIYLADKFAFTEAMRRVYGAFGLTDTEIACISSAQMKRDYFYTSPLGRRMFQLDLGILTHALIGAPNHALLDRLIAEKGAGVPLCEDILKSCRVGYKHLVDIDAPRGRLPGPAFPKPLPLPAASAQAGPPFPPESASAPYPSSSAPAPSAAAILDAVSSVPERRKKGGGRAADALAKEFGVSSATIYRAKAVLESGDAELVASVRRGDTSLKKAFKILSGARAAV